jgi:uncharacterized coiled-coil protein SlyX
MSNEIENLVLEHLKKIQIEQAAARERDTEIFSRLGHIETSLARLHSYISGMEEASAEHSVRMDRMAMRIDRIERRLELS